MTATARKYNPGFLSDEELVASFCVRTREFESMIEVLRACSGSANQHQIVIGMRGSGKTSLLLRIGAEIRRDAGLSSRFFPVVFAEESYEVSSAGEFWLECLSRLADQAPAGGDGPDLGRTFEELRAIRDDRTLADRCLGTLQDFSDREGKRLVLIVENLNMMLLDMADPDAEWRLRQTLQNEPRILILASATSRFDEIDDPERALYDLFRELSLSPLNVDECATLWRIVSGQDRAPEMIQALRILTGGSPRLLTIVARFGARLSFRELMADLLNLVDDHTEYFKSHLDSLPAQERRVYLALADLWKPATTREIAERARLDTSKCSAHLGRLSERGSVEVAGGSARRKLYYLTERLYNIYYLMRRARGPAPLIEALIHFMEAYYSPSELKEFGLRMAREAAVSDARTQLVYRTAFDRLIELPSLETHREELTSLAPWIVPDRPDYRSAASAGRGEARALVEKGITLAEENRVGEALALWDDVVRRFGASASTEDLEAVGMALVNRGTALGRLNRSEEALAAWEEVARRFGASDALVHRHAVVRSLVCKGAMLAALNRLEAALSVWDEADRRFGADDAPGIVLEVASGLVASGHVFAEMRRPDEALQAWGEVVRRFGGSDIPEILHHVAGALVNQATLLRDLNRPEEALATWDDILRRFWAQEAPAFLVPVAGALLNKGNVLAEVNRGEEALAAWGEVVERFGNEGEPPLPDIVVTALVNKGTALVATNRHEEALAVWNDVERRLEAEATPAIPEPVALALMGKGASLTELNRTEEALTVWNEVVEGFEESEVPAVVESVAAALFNKGSALARLNRVDEALASLDEVAQRFKTSESARVLHVVAAALVYKGTVLFGLGRLEEALTAWDDVVERFGNSTSPAVLEQVAMALGGKGAALIDLNRFEEAGEAWDEVVQRFGTSDIQFLRSAAELGYLNKAGLELGHGRAEAAIETVNQVLEQEGSGVVETRLRGHLIRSRARLDTGDKSACMQDVEAVLAMLPTLASLPKDALDMLSDLAVDLGPAQVRDLIQASPAAELLLPLTVALERELGLDPRVAKEIAEVAEDIRRDMAEYRKRNND